jgi:surface polysaccharide O-acyltransferase-like enzyme
MDTLRSIGMLLVIMVHVSANYVVNGFDKIDINFWVGNIFDSFSRIAVPVFLLISGQFLLGRHDTILEFYKKRISRIFLPIIFWSIFYSVYYPIGKYIIKNEWDFNIKQIFHNLISGKPFYHMWYLFMIIGLYLVTPFINELCLKSNIKQINKTGFILLIFGFVLNIWNNYLGSD